MKWNWQHKDWPNFRYKKQEIEKLEADFLYASCLNFGVYQHLNSQDQENLTIELISDEALKTYHQIDIVSNGQQILWRHSSDEKIATKNSRNSCQF